MKKLIKRMALTAASFLAALFVAVPVQAADRTELFYYPNANAQGAWTLPVHEGRSSWIKENKCVGVGERQTITVTPGYHLYGVETTGNIDIAKWRVAWESHLCVHNIYDQTFAESKGLHGYIATCGEALSSGWWPTCAYCGEEIKINFYTDEKNIKKVTSIPAGSFYYSVCSYPDCGGFEQGRPIEHFCRSKISANKFTIIYDKNGGSGYMADSDHYTNDDTEYEGKEVTPQKNLSQNAYRKPGYYFAGWNTKRDGTGESYSDEDKVWPNEESYIKNKVLNSSNKTEITLYAQWKPCSSTLSVDANGGTYLGQPVYDVTKNYGETYHIYTGYLSAPNGSTLYLNSGSFGQAVNAAGASISSIVEKKIFSGWSYDNTFAGKLEGNIYTFLRTTQSGKDVVTAQYTNRAYTLPKVMESDPANHKFVGWYYDSRYTTFAGKAGDQITISSDTTLYAAYSSLWLNATNNYSANNGKGAVNLTWGQNDTERKSYEIFQTANADVAKKTTDTQLASEWTKITSSAGNSSSVPNAATTFNKVGESQTIRVAYAGIYHIYAYGASGSNYGSYTGGKGGYVGGDVYLEKDEVLTIVNGGAGTGVNSGGYNGGGTGSTFGNGGGMTTVTSDKKGLLFVAGGGGAATDQENGHAGGMEQNLVASGNNGENGYAGGGAGYRGGCAGENIVHHHVSRCYTNISKTADSRFYETNANSFSASAGRYENDIAYDDTGVTNSFHTREDSGTAYVQVGDSSNYFSTPGSGTLTFNVSAYMWGDLGPS